MALDDTPLIFPAIVALLDDRFSPKAVQVSQAEWRNWAGSADAEVRERMEARFRPQAVALTRKEWPALRGLLFEAMGSEAQAQAESLEAAPPYAPFELIRAVPEPLATLVMRFRSANSCPVDRIHIQRQDWVTIRALAVQFHETARAIMDAHTATEAKNKRRSLENPRGPGASE